ncbi:MAG: D-alanyl-D-alanine dipeptidase [Legionella sp.]|nr:MAG: D-alanyl-D-alanine dipeptidase [Legionella sp.]
MKKIYGLLLSLFLVSNAYALPKGFVYLSDVAPDIIQDMRYATTNNFIGNPIPGYKKGVCILSRQAAEQLQKAQKAIKAQGYTLKVYDCYRPQQAVNYFYKWSQNPKDQRNKAEFYPRENKNELFAKDYIALSSGHSRGSTMDLTLVKLTDLQPKSYDGHLTRCFDKTPKYQNDNSLDMGTRYDCLDRRANVANKEISQVQHNNRLLLGQLMKKYGFKPYYSEWWHYTLRNEPYPKSYFNFPVA